MSFTGALNRPGIFLFGLCLDKIRENGEFMFNELVFLRDVKDVS